MTTTKAEVERALQCDAFVHDEGAIAYPQEIAPLWQAENTWVDGVRYTCGGGVKYRPLSSFCARYTLRNTP